MLFLSQQSAMLGSLKYPWIDSKTASDDAQGLDLFPCVCLWVWFMNWFPPLYTANNPETDSTSKQKTEEADKKTEETKK